MSIFENQIIFNALVPSFFPNTGFTQAVCFCNYTLLQQQNEDKKMAQLFPSFSSENCSAAPR